MAATVSWSQFNGASGTETTSIASIALKSVDDATTSYNNASIAAGYNSFTAYYCPFVNLTGTLEVLSPYYQVSTNSPASGVTIAGAVINNYTSSVAYVAPQTSATGDSAIFTSNAVYVGFFGPNSGTTGGAITSGRWNACNSGNISPLSNVAEYASPIRMQLQTTSSAAINNAISFTVTFGWQEIG